MQQRRQLPEATKSAWYDRLRDYATAIADDPQTNSVFRLAQDVFFDLSAGRVSFDELSDVLTEIETDLFHDRAAFLRRQHGLDQPAEQTLRQKLTGLAEDGFDAFRAKITAPMGGIVFTAHPTFANPKPLRKALSAIASGETADYIRTRSGITDTEQITLREEHEEAQDAIRHAQSSVRSFVRLIFEVAEKQFPDQWRTLEPVPPTLASWVAYDLDGRNDIAWWTSLGFRLQEKAGQLSRYAAQLTAIGMDGPGASEIQELVQRLHEASDISDRQAKAFFEDLSHPEKLVRAANALTDPAGEKLTSLRDIEISLMRLAANASPDAARDLLVLKTEMETIGLGTARIHLRINAAQIQSVIRRDLGLSTENPDIGQVALETLAGKIADGEEVRINFSDLFLEQATAKRQLMLCAQIHKHIDADQPIRFLIAESENPATVLGAVYLARLYGIAHQLDISPLFETPEALENGGRFIERLLKVPAFREYVSSRNQLSIQLGFSDAGRFIGQVSADIAIERIQNQIARALADRLPGTPLLFFNTHGESVGRGGYPGGFRKRLLHVLPHKTMSTCARLGIPLRNEVSFQGGDGYLHFNTQILSDTAYSAFADFALFEDPTDETDPFYSRSSLVWDFYRALRQWHETLFDDPNYGILLSDFAGGFLIDAGSRPKRRSGGPAGPRSLRAISHNATLQQLGVLANTACGIGSSLEKESGELIDLINHSPRLRALIDMAVFSRVRTTIPSLRGYAAVYSPAFWVACSKRAESSRTGARVTMAKLLEDGRTHYAIMSCANRFSVDLGRFDRLIAKLDKAPSVESRHEARLAIHTIHAIRQGAMMYAMEIAGGLPMISARHGFDIGDVQSRILNMQIGEAVDSLTTLFPRTGAEIPEFSQLKEARSNQADFTPRDYTALHEELVTPLQSVHALNRRISRAICHAHFAYG